MHDVGRRRVFESAVSFQGIPLQLQDDIHSSWFKQHTTVDFYEGATATPVHAEMEKTKDGKYLSRKGNVKEAHPTFGHREFETEEEYRRYKNAFFQTAPVPKVKHETETPKATIFPAPGAFKAM